RTRIRRPLRSESQRTTNKMRRPAVNQTPREERMTAHGRDGLSDPSDPQRERYSQDNAASSRNAPINDLIEAAFAGLGNPPSPDELVEAVRRLRQGLGGVDALTNAATRHEAVARLEQAGKSAREAKELLRAAFEADKPSSPTKLQGAGLDMEDPQP